MNVRYDEVKIGGYVAYQEKCQFQFAPDEKPGEERTGELICVAEDKLVLYGESPANLKRILERNKEPALGAMEKAMKTVDLENTSFMLLNLKDLPDSRKDRVKVFLPFVGAEEVMNASEAISVQAKLGPKLEAKATFITKNDEAASSLKKTAEMGIATFNGFLGVMKADKRTPPETRKLAEDGATLLESIKLSTKGNQAIAELSADPTVVVKTIIAAITLEKGDRKPAPKSVETPK